MKSCHFSKITIIQSLDKHYTGKRLYEDIDIFIVAKDFDVKIEIFNVATRTELLKLFEELTSKVISSGEYPIVHIESHGSREKDGLILSSGDFVSWNDLKTPLINLNIATMNNLLVVLAACNGAYITEILQLTDRAPCWGLVGPKREVVYEAILKNFSAFYKEVLTSGDGDRAVKLLNEDAKEREGDYFFKNAESFFKEVFIKYITVSCSPKSLKERARRMRKQLIKSKSAVLPSRNQIEQGLGKTKEPFEKYKNKFFMIDLFPENAKRFTIEYADLLSKTRDTSQFTR